MIIQCDQCSARFKLDDSKVTESGVKVRCKRCHHIFQVRKELPPEADITALFTMPEESPEETPPEAPAEPPPPDAAEFTAPGVSPEPDTEPSTAAPPDDCHFSFEFALPTTESDDGASASQETTPPDTSNFALSQPDDIRDFSFMEESAGNEAAMPPPPKEPAFETTEWENEWGEVDIPVPQPLVVAAEPAEIDFGGVIEVNQDEKPEAPKPDEFEGFDFEPSEPGGAFAEPDGVSNDGFEPPEPDGFDRYGMVLPEEDAFPAESSFDQDTVPDETTATPDPTALSESADDEAFNFPEWAPEDGDTIPASPPLPLTLSKSDDAPPVLTKSDDAPPASSPTNNQPSVDLMKVAVTPPVVPETPSLGDAVTSDSPDADTSQAPPAFPRRREISPMAIRGMILGALLVLVVGGGGALYLLAPDVLRLLKTEETVQERILVKKLEGTYVNSNEGKELFVIRGEALNSFPIPQTAIQVRGLIYNSAGTVILRKNVFCGNPLSPEQLATLPLAKIEEAMNTRSPADSDVPAGKTARFVIVFTSLPKAAVDFGVEVVAAQPAGKKASTK